jgi:hypothetical protein
MLKWSDHMMIDCIVRLVFRVIKAVKVNQKFVTFKDYHGEQIIVFPDHIQHAKFAAAVSGAAFSKMMPIAGGFVVDGKCVGESVSLRMSSRPEDTELLKSLFGGSIEQPEANEDKSRPINSPSLTKNQRKRLNKKR